MRRPALVLALGVVCASAVFAQRTASSRPLEIYVVDVEGGKADLWVTPQDQTLLIDTGSPGGRDVARIKEVMQVAGVTRLDYLLSTHYHVDHVGGLQELVTTVPVATFIDHGPTVEDGAEGHQREQVQGFQAAYAELYGKAKHLVVRPGDKIPLNGVDWTIVTSAGKMIAKTTRATANPACANEPRVAAARDPENAQSVGSLIAFGQFRALDLGDLTQDAEYDLMCPQNAIGTVDLFFASNHGLMGGANTPALIHAIQPRVATVQNSAGKGASLDMFHALRSSPRLEDVWQLHWGNAAGVEQNSPGVFIANGVDPAAIAAALTAPPRGGGGRPASPPPAANAPGATASAPAAASASPGPGTPVTQGQGPGGPPAGPVGAAAARGGGFGGGAVAAAHSPAYWVKVSVMPNGTFTLTNSRNEFTKTYTSQARAALGGARGKPQ